MKKLPGQLVVGIFCLPDRKEVTREYHKYTQLLNVLQFLFSDSGN